MNRWAAIARLGGIGDNLIAASPLRPLKRLGYKTEVITSPFGAAVFQNNPFIDKLTVKADSDIPKEQWQQWFVKRANEYDIFAHLSHSCEARHSLHVGSTDFWHRPEYRRKICAGSFLETVHDIVGVPHHFGPLYFPAAEELENATKSLDASIGRKFVTWIICGSRLDKVYPYAGMVVARIAKELDTPVLLFGVGEKQQEWAKQLKEHVKRQNGTNDNIGILVSHEGMPTEQRWGIRPSFAHLFLSKLVITPDTGAAWAVAMESIPKVMLLSHASAENVTKHWINTTTLHADQNRVPCWPCHRLHDDISTCVPNKDDGKAAACMSDISAEKIIECASAAIAPSAAS